MICSCAATKTHNSSLSKEEQVVITAQAYLGSPYRYGGTTKAGMDCSGLLIKSYASVGVDLPRTAHEQSKVGKKVPIDELKEGDMIFFSASPGKGKVTHAGIVTKSSGGDHIYFIHSSSVKGVVEANLYDDYYIKRFVEGRRIKF